MNSLPVTAPPTQPTAPWHYRLGKWLGRRGVRGSGLLIRVPHRLGLLRRVVRFPVQGEYTIDVPLYRQATQWDAQQIAEYEVDYLHALAQAIQHLPPPVTLIDCGADIGLATVALVARCANIASAVAFEPDPHACELLARNLARLPIPCECHCRGVGDVATRARLTAAGSSEHARYLTPADDGPVEIARLDDSLAGRSDLMEHSLVLKIDVEGHELATLRGARRLLRDSPNFVVGFEAHRLVAQRTGVDPIECARWLADLRPGKFTISERPELPLSLEQPFFAQVASGDIFNVIATSASAT